MNNPYIFPEYCWIPAPSKSSKSQPPFSKAKILHQNTENSSFTYQSIDLSQSIQELPISNIIPHFHIIPDNGYSNLLDLPYINPAEILNNLHLRYEKSHIHTNIGNSLLIINPNKFNESEYSNEKLQFYTKKLKSALISNHFNESKDPHIYSKAAFAYFSLCQSKRNQAILIHGIAGSGKTENTKFAMKFLVSLNNSENSTNFHENSKNPEISIEEKIVSCIPILEAFGNAKTENNPNSSRFGKFIRILIEKNGLKIQGAAISSYLLEKSRVSSHAKTERNYHIFYHILKGLNSDEKKKFLLEEMLTYNDFQYLRHDISEEILDLESNMRLFESFKKMNFTSEEYEAIISILLSILYIGNIDFTDHDEEGPQLSSEHWSMKLSQLLGLSHDKLIENLRYKIRIIDKQVIKSPLTIIECRGIRDSLARGMYDQLFNWLIKRLNLILIPKNDVDESIPLRKSLQFLRKSLNNPSCDKLAIGLLNIFGFENLNFNGFEQFCINFLSEKLHQMYLMETFKLETKIINEEGLESSYIEADFHDNQGLLDLFEKFPLGIFDLLDESTALASNDDKKLLEKIIKTHQNHQNFIKPKAVFDCFGIYHSGNHVEYNIQGFRSKNKDEIPKELQDTIEESQNLLISNIFKGFCGFETEKMLDYKKKFKEKNTGDKGILGIRNKTDKFLGAKFRAEIRQLLEELNTYDVNFVRCLKGNSENKPDFFEFPLIFAQIKSLEIYETVKVRKSGFCYKKKYKEFLKEFGRIIGIYGKKDLDSYEGDKLKENCTNILAILAKKEVLLGNTRVLIKYEGVRRLEAIMIGMLKKMERKIEELLKRNVKGENKGGVVIKQEEKNNVEESINDEFDKGEKKKAELKEIEEETEYNEEYEKKRNIEKNEKIENIGKIGKNEKNEKIEKSEENNELIANIEDKAELNEENIKILEENLVNDKNLSVNNEFKEEGKEISNENQEIMIEKQEINVEQEIEIDKKVEKCNEIDENLKIEENALDNEKNELNQEENLVKENVEIKEKNEKNEENEKIEENEEKKENVENQQENFEIEKQVKPEEINENKVDFIENLEIIEKNEENKEEIVKTHEYEKQQEILEENEKNHEKIENMQEVKKQDLEIIEITQENAENHTEIEKKHENIEKITENEKNEENNQKNIENQDIDRNTAKLVEIIENEKEKLNEKSLNLIERPEQSELLDKKEDFMENPDNEINKNRENEEENSKKLEIQEKQESNKENKDDFEDFMENPAKLEKNEEIKESPSKISDQNDKEKKDDFEDFMENPAKIEKIEEIKESPIKISKKLENEEIFEKENDEKPEKTKKKSQDIDPNTDEMILEFETSHTRPQNPPLNKPISELLDEENLLKKIEMAKNSKFLPEIQEIDETSNSSKKKTINDNPPLKENKFFFHSATVDAQSTENMEKQVFHKNHELLEKYGEFQDKNTPKFPDKHIDNLREPITKKYSLDIDEKEHQGETITKSKTQNLKLPISNFSKDSHNLGPLLSARILNQTNDLKLEAEIEKLSLMKSLRKSIILCPREPIKEPIANETLIDAINEFLDEEEILSLAIKRSQECLSIITNRRNSEKPRISLIDPQDYIPNSAKDTSMLELFLPIKSMNCNIDLDASPYCSDLHLNINSLDPEFIKNVLSNPFSQFCEKYLPKRTTWSGKIINSSELLSFSKGKLPFSLTPLNKSDEKMSQKTFKLILEYLFEKDEEKTLLLAKELVEIGFSNTQELRNEIFLQILKQTNKNPDIIILTKCYILLLVFSSFFRISEVFLYAILQNLYIGVQTNQKNDEYRIIRSLNKACFMRILRVFVIGNRKIQPRTQELKIISKVKKIIIQVILPNNWDYFISVPIEPYTTVLEAKLSLLKFLNIQENQDFFGLFALINRNNEFEEIFLDDKEKYMDILNDLEVQKEDFEQRVNQGKKKGFNKLWFFDYRIILKIRVFFKLFENDSDSLNFYYIQHQGDFINNRFPVIENDLYHIITISFLISYDMKLDNPLEIRSISKLLPKNYKGNIEKIIENIKILLEKYETLDKKELKIKLLEILKKYDAFMAHNFVINYYQINKGGIEVNKGHFRLALKPLQLCFIEEFSSKTILNYDFNNIKEWGINKDVYFLMSTDDGLKHVCETHQAGWIEYLMRNYSKMILGKQKYDL